MTVPLPSLFERAVAHHQAGRFAEAEPLYREIIAADPNHADAHRALGALLLQRKNAGEGFAFLERALVLGAPDASTLNNIGFALNELERFDDALKHLDAALALKPDYAAAHNNRGLALRGLKKFDAALQSFESALRCQPGFPDALVNIGRSYISLQRLDDAVALYSKLITVPSHAEVAYFNRAKAFASLGQYDDALADYAWVRKSGGVYANAATLASAMLKLLLGQFDDGCPLYESRWQADPKLKLRAFSQALWLGNESLAGKTILLHAEQGFGDTLQFIRYLPRVKAIAARVLLIVQPQLLSLLQPLWPDVQMFSDAKALPAFDMHCPLMSLPLAFKTTLQTIPAEIPYVQADQAKRDVWLQRLQPSDKRRVGIVWSGRPTHVNDVNRSVSLDVLGPLFKTPHQFHALQNEILPHDREVLARLGVVSHDQDLKDFSDTAALIAELDLVITVDTSVAHVAGALGKPVWLLLPYDPDFRWLLKRSDSPWYPSAKLYRQAKPGDWSGVIQRVLADLSA